ncbi:MAG: 4Fe-4S binding protein [Flavobacteriales bacterium]|nr:4Fe-4S binding protein [Flavobacteriales bacterium]
MKSYQQAWLKLEGRISEGLSMPDAHQTAGRNMTGTTTALSPTGNLAFVAGMSTCGMRCSAWIGTEHTAENIHTLHQAVRNLTPMVVAAPVAMAARLANSGAFVLFASDAQELIDLTIIAHRVSELALIPGAVVFRIADDDDTIPVVPENHQLFEFLGDGGNRIPAPTSSQLMLFGKTRRRIPKQFNADIPVLTGAQKSAKGISYQAAAHRAFFTEHVEEFIAQTFGEFEKQFIRKHQAFLAKDADRADLIIFSDNRHVFNLTATLKGRSKLGAVLLKQYHPVPSTLMTGCGKASSIAVVEQLTDEHCTLFPRLCETFAGRPVQLRSAQYAHSPASANLQDFIGRIERNELKADHFLLDIPHINESSEFPKRQSVFQTIKRDYPQLADRGALVPNPTTNGTAIAPPAFIPLSLRRFKNQGPIHSRLSNFFDNTAPFYGTDSADWTADPFQSTPSMPSASAGLGHSVEARKSVPVLDSSKCTGCGDCFVHCPHAAIPPVALDMEAILKSGIAKAQANGVNITQLFPQVKNLAKTANKVIPAIVNAGNSSLMLREILTPAFDQLLEQVKPQAEKADAFKAEFKAIAAAIGDFQVVANGTFFNDGAKELFSLAIDPSACVGCGICASVCPDGALSMADENEEQHASLQKQFALWEQLPDTSSETIQRLMADRQYPSLAALMLSRNFYMSMTGATANTRVSEKAMIHTVAAVAEAMVQPGFKAMEKVIGEKIENIAANLKKQLSDALPGAIDNGLGSALDRITTAKVSIDEILESQSDARHLRLLDRASLSRKSDIIKELHDLKDLIVSGATGTGRARYCIALDSSLAELATFPDNCFTVPVLCFDGSSAEMAKGLIQGHLRHVLENIKVLRRATLEETGKYNPAHHDHAIADLSWADLSDQERTFVPPMLLIARKSLLQSNGANTLAQLLAEGLPIKVILLDNVNPPEHTAIADMMHDAMALIPFIALRNVRVIQGSLADPDHLFDGLVSALGNCDSSVIRLLTPDGEHGNMQLLHSLASNSRAYIQFDYSPNRESTLLFPKMSIDVNPSSDAEWCVSELSYMEDGQEKVMAYKVTYADWAYTGQNRKSSFTLWNEAMGEPMHVAQFIRLQSAERKGKVPVIVRTGSKGELQHHTVPAAIVGETEAALKAWMTVREIAGTLAEFPEKVYATAERELSIKYEAEQEKLTTLHAESMKNAEAAHLEKVRAQLKEKLMKMAAAR